MRSRSTTGAAESVSDRSAHERQASETSATLPEAWKVDLPVFQGPLDLLLHLTRVNEVEISDISGGPDLRSVPRVPELMDEMNLDIAGEYIYEAATLIHLKSRLLLPRPAVDAETQEDPRQELVRRLLEYRRLKEAAQSLAETHAVRRGIWTRNVDPRSLGLRDEETVDLERRVAAHSARAPQTGTRPLRSRAPRPSVAGAGGLLGQGPVRPIARRPQRQPALRPVGGLRGRSSRGEVVSAFLAVLELARLHLVRLHQTDDGEVLLYRTTREPTAEELEAISDDVETRI